MALSSSRRCSRLLPLILLIASALPPSAFSEATLSSQHEAAARLASTAAGTRHLLQYQGFVLNETPRESMERMKREMLTSQQSAIAAKAAALTSSAATSLISTSSAAAQSSSKGKAEEQMRKDVLQKMYKKADTSAPREGSRAEDAALQVEAAEETSIATSSTGDSDSDPSGAGETAQSAVLGLGAVAGSSQEGAEAAAAATLARRELPGCTLKMYGGRPAKSGKEKYGGWTMCSEGVRKGAIVYSFGIGSDVSFDYAVLRRGAKVYGFDPTKTPEYVRQIFNRQFGINEFPRRFKYYQVGLGATDGTVPFYRSTAKVVGSMTAVPLSQLTDYKDVGFYAKVQTLTTCRRQLRHRWIDVLKIDAEGVELDACESRPFLRALGQVTQVLFEFHDRMVSGGKRKKLRCIRRMQALNFTLVHQTVRAREVTFARLSQFSKAQGRALAEKRATA